MNKVFYLLASAVMLATQPASAQTFTPAGTYVLTGTVLVTQSIQLTCILSVTLAVPSTPSSTATATMGIPPFQAGNLLCASLAVSGTPYNVTFDPATAKLSLNGVVINTPLTGSCSGEINGTWNNVTKKLVINASLPGIGAAAPCTIMGTLTGPVGLSIS